MRSRVVILLVLLCLAQIGLGAYLLLRPSAQPAPSGGRGPTPAPQGRGIEGLPPGAGYELEGSTLTLTAPDGTPEWRLEMETIQVLQGQNQARVTGVRAERIEAGRTALKMKAGWATLDWDSRAIRFGGGVEAESVAGGPEGARFAAGSCTCDAAARKVTAQGDVEFRRGGIVIRGQTLSADMELTRVVVEGQAKMTAVRAATPGRE